MSPLTNGSGSETPYWSRRTFVSSLTSAASALSVAVGPPSTRRVLASTPTVRRPSETKKIALIATEVRQYSHAQHFIDRFLEGYGWHGEHHYPPMELVSLYVDQFPDGDLSQDRTQRHPVRIFPTIAEACTLGGNKLAVDAVVIIGEHGQYPNNRKGQKRYPRYSFFKEVVEVFEDSGRAVPVFNDKHLSTRWSESAEMVADSQRLGFPFLAGSSLPVTWRIPSVEMPWGTPLEESVCVCYGGVDSYDFHGLETAQCMSERRAGGESGIRAVQALRGAPMWDRIRDNRQTSQLVLNALSRSHTVKAPSGFTFPVISLSWAEKMRPEAVGYFIEHTDGMRTNMLMLNGLLSDFNYAGKVKNSDRIISCQMYLPMPPRYTTLANFFSPLVNNIEKMILSNLAPYPIERTLLTTGMTLFGVESLYRGQVRLETPEMNIPYVTPRTSTYWRA